MSTDPSPIVVLGFPRSGVTLLSRLFDAHPQVSCPPETNLLSACGRFLHESAGEGPPLGVVSGLALSGIGEEFVLGELRRMVFAVHARLAGGKPVWMEKSGFDIFYLEAVERLLAGHCRFVCAIRHPLDVVVSVKELVEKTGHYMPELHAFIRQHENPHEAFAAAWMDRDDALRAFIARQPERCLTYRYEDLVGDPAATLARIAAFIGVAPLTPDLIAASFSDPGRMGLGDWKVDERRAVDKASLNRWRQALPRATAARLIARLAPFLERHGYPVPKAARVPDREEILRQFDVARRMHRSASRTP